MKYIRQNYWIMIIGLTLFGLVVGTEALAQGPVDETAFQQFAEQAGFAQADIRVVVARLIRTALSFAGVVLLGLIIYGGFLWMTSGGQAEKISKAKKVLVNAVIGMVIIMSAWAITTFVISSLVDAVGGGTGTGEEGDDPWDPGDNPPIYDEFIIESYGCATGDLPNKNVVVTILFNNSVDTSTIASNIQIQDPLGDPVDGTFDTEDDEVMFTPSAVCPEDPAEFCFDANTTYTVQIGAGLKETGGELITCGSPGEDCQSTFTTGDLIDTSDPSVEMTYPDDGGSVPVGELALMQSIATDDGGINRVKFYVDSSFEDNGVVLNLGEPDLYSANWTEPSLGSHNLSTRAYDCSGRSTLSDSITVSALVAHCTNGVQDEDESGVDCGGDDCLSCDGESCTENGDCASGICEEGTCVGYPEITYVSPTQGTSGNYITISGEYFNDAEGEVWFLGADTDGDGDEEGDDDDVQALVADCADPWTSTQVVVEVPNGFVDGPIIIVTEPAEADGPLSDRTDDYDRGPVIIDFTEDGTVRPSMCDVNPESGLPDDIVVATGKNFGTTEDNLYLLYGNTGYEPSEYQNWNDESISFPVPQVSARNYQVQVFVEGNGSNTVQFTVSSETEQETPVISYVDSGLDYCADNTDLACSADSDCAGTCTLDVPNYCSNDPTVTGCTIGDDTPCNFGACEDYGDTGPIGQYVTIYGENFDDDPPGGIVWFRDSTGATDVADVDFPDACASNWWADDNIIMKVPEWADGGSAAIWIERDDGAESNEAEFTVTSGSPGPSICAIDPTNGPEGLLVDLYGERFGSVQGSVDFYDGVAVTNIDYWGGDGEQVRVEVPSGATTGPVTLYDNGGTASNTINFEVASCLDGGAECAQGETCCDDGACRATCPSETIPESEYLWRFSTGEIPDAPQLIVECSDDWISPTPYTAWPNGEEVCVNSMVQGSFETDPGVELASITTSTVIVEKCVGLDPDDPCSDLETVDGEFDDKFDTTFQWISSPAGTVFDPSTWYQVTLVGGIGGITSPDGEPLETDYEWQFQTRTDTSDCEIESVLLLPPEKSYTFVEENSDFDASAIGAGGCQVLYTPGDVWTWYAEHTGNTDWDDIIDLVSLDFDTYNVEAESETEPGHVVELTAEITDENLRDSSDIQVNFEDPRVEDRWPECEEACVNAVVGATFNLDMDSSSFNGNVRLYECSDALCNLGTTEVVGGTLNYNAGDWSISLSPPSDLEEDTYYLVRISGDDPSTTDQVEGVLSLSGTGLSGDEEWIFKTKADSAPCGIERVEVNPEREVLDRIGAQQAYEATAYGGPDECSPSGQRLDAYDYAWNWEIDNTVPDNYEIAFFTPANLDTTRELPDGCSSLCLNEGSDYGVSVCGNGVEEFGEDCDDGPGLPLDGDGCSATCTTEGTAAVADGGTCGNGSMDGFEECDDGNNDDLDGCSSVCTNEGSGYAGTVCGDGIILHNDAIGGEECDDGNNSSGDGCSNICLNEGSLDATEITAVCGNGTREDGEDCDDGNGTNGDGCSSRCLNESGECDPADEGCSDDGLFEGSNHEYSTPSFCGDGNYGTGEECEAALAGGDGLIDPFQVAEISEGAIEASVVLDENPIMTDLRAEGTDSQTGTGATGEAEVGVNCSCEEDLDCGVATYTTIGCGFGGCCADRPTATFAPDAREDVCRNASVSAEFDSLMDTESFRVQVGNETVDNIFLIYLGSGVLVDGEAQPDADLETGDCPSGYEESLVALHEGDRPWYVRAWRFVANKVAGLFGREVYAQDPVVCYMEGTLSNDLSESSTEVTFTYSQPLEENSLYRLVVVGDQDLQDDNTEAAYNIGVTTQYGITIRPTITDALYGFEANQLLASSFKTGTEVCELEDVLVEDKSSSPGLFTEAAESHDLEAAAYTIRNNVREEITPIAGYYDWTWSWGITGDGSVLNLSDPAATTDLNDAVAESKNGEEDIVASATVTSDSFNDPSTTGEVISGSVEEMVFLCENPWPQVGTFPFSDTEEYDTAFEGLGLGDFGPSVRTDLGSPFPYSNFSFYYCRDAGDAADTSDDLPNMRVVEAPNPQTTSGVFRELLFMIDGDDYTDAVGVRIAGNEDYYSPGDWYDANFDGSYSSTDDVDGYEAVQDGRTVYVNAANQTGDIYSNIYAIAYNEGAEDETLEVFEQVLDSWAFNANDVLLDDEFCYETDAYANPIDTDNATDGLQLAECSYDAECFEYGADAVCGAQKQMLQRDTIRLSDLRSMYGQIDTYGSTNSRCSVTKTMACFVDDNCPGGETCVQTVPELQVGSFLRSRSYSAWPSWQAQLGNNLGAALPTDPLNNLADCPEGYDETSCWNGDASQFVCNEGSHVYGFRSIAGEAYELFVDLEYNGAPWAYDLDQDTTDWAEITVGNASESNPDGFTTSLFCDGTELGLSEECGDGVVGENETCEIGDTQTVDCDPGEVYICFNDVESSYYGTVCDPAGDVVATCGADGECASGVCSNGDPCNDSIDCGGGTCTYIEGQKTVTCCYSGNCAVSGSADCSAYQEAADSASSCTPYLCGNGVVDDGEECDDGAFNGQYGYCGLDCDVDGAIFCGDGTLAGSEVCDCGYNEDFRTSGAWAVANSCQYVNGIYSYDPDEGCAFNCAGDPPSCGDGVVNGSEECDGESETWDGAICSSGSLEGEPCEIDDDCEGGTCGNVSGYEACESSQLCDTGDEIGKPCQTDGECANGTCSTFEFETMRTRVCDSDIAAGTGCFWPEADSSHFVGGWDEIGGESCIGTGYCGNGVTEGTEECDDGNDDNNDECTTSCLFNVCGDGKRYDGIEACDWGAGNAVPCEAPYGGSCNYCTASCQYQTMSGGYCGDDQVNGSEFCDGTDMPINYCILKDEDPDRRDISGACDSFLDCQDLCDNNDLCDDDGDGIADKVYECAPAGYCNGGYRTIDDELKDFNGVPCDVNAGIADYDDNCGQNPFSFPPTTSLGTCVAPECNDNCSSGCPFSLSSVSVQVEAEEEGSLKTDSVDLYSFGSGDSPDTALMYFPACRVGSSLTADVSFAGVTPPYVQVFFIMDLSTSMNELLDGSDSRLDVAKEATIDAIGELFDSFEDGTIEIGLASFSSPGTGNIDYNLSTSEDEYSLINTVNAYSASGSTYPEEGLEAVYNELENPAPEDTVQVVVLLSDGSPTAGDGENTVDEWARRLKRDCEGQTGTLDLYTAALTGSSSLKGYMAHWSSDVCERAGIMPDVCSGDEPDDISDADNCSPSNNGIEYAYSSETAEDLRDMYEAIVESIIGKHITYTTDAGTSSGTMNEGNSQPLLFPIGFECPESDEEFTVPFRISFPGTGTVNLTNIEMNYCPF